MTTEPMPVVLEGITKSFGSVLAVDNVSLAVRKGEFLTLLGPSGCGKTTTLRLIAGLEEPDKGHIYIGNNEVTLTPPYKRNIGMFFQNYALFPNMDVFRNVAFGLKMRKVASNEIGKRVRASLDLVRLHGLEKRHIGQLSGGQQQRVALARVLVTEPQVLLLDEPLSNIDALLRDEMRVELRLLQAKLGVTTILVTHDQVEALVMSDRISVMNEGRIVGLGTPESIYESPPCDFVSKFVGKSNVFEGRLSLIDQTVRTDTGLTIHTHNRPDLEEGNVKIMIRPEKTEILPHETALSENVFPGRVEFTNYIGSITRYNVRLESNDVVIVEVPNSGGDPGYRIGDRACVRMRPEGLVLSRESQSLA